MALLITFCLPQLTVFLYVHKKMMLIKYSYIEAVSSGKKTLIFPYFCKENFGIVHWTVNNRLIPSYIMITAKIIFFLCQ